jgi:hypothetical protein
MQTKKKIAQTDAIFSYVHSVNQIADQTDGVIRLSIDTKATVKVGDYSRGGYSRQGVKAAQSAIWAGTEKPSAKGSKS